MCNVLLPDPTNALWVLSCDDLGRVQTTLSNLAFLAPGPILSSGGASFWQLTADALGRVVATPIVPQYTWYSRNFLLLTSPSGFSFKLTIDDLLGQLATDPNATLVADPFPMPLDVTMSHWPDGYNGVICPRCNNSSITVGADMSCWCCVCSSFVAPEDTTIIVALSE